MSEIPKSIPADMVGTLDPKKARLYLKAIYASLDEYINMPGPEGIGIISRQVALRKEKPAEWQYILGMSNAIYGFMEKGDAWKMTNQQIQEGLDYVAFFWPHVDKARLENGILLSEEGRLLVRYELLENKAIFHRVLGERYLNVKDTEKARLEFCQEAWTRIVEDRYLFGSVQSPNCWAIGECLVYMGEPELGNSLLDMARDMLGRPLVIDKTQIKLGNLAKAVFNMINSKK